MRSKEKERILAWIKVVIGSLIMAVAYNLFFIPNALAPGGVSGLAVLLNALTGWPVGLMIALLNIPLFALGWRKRGRVFMLRTLFAVFLLSLFIDYVRLPQGVYEVFKDQVLLAAGYGGLMVGAALALVISANATTGGTDLAAILVQSKIPSMKISHILLGIDGLVITGAALVFSPVQALYALASLFISAKVMDVILSGGQSAKAFFIVSEKEEQLAQCIMKEVDRGVTLMRGWGAYSRAEKGILLCVVEHRQIGLMKQIIAREDPQAFVMMNDAREVLGEGFGGHNLR